MTSYSRLEEINVGLYEVDIMIILTSVNDIILMLKLKEISGVMAILSKLPMLLVSYMGGQFCKVTIFFFFFCNVLNRFDQMKHAWVKEGNKYYKQGIYIKYCWKGLYNFHYGSEFVDMQNCYVPYTK